MMKKIIITFFLFYISIGISQINKAEYFIDFDPGVGLGTDIPLASSSFNISENFQINTGSLGTGIHTLYVRIRDVNNVWSLYYKHTFLVHDFASTSASSQIVAAEYFIDTDPGVNNGVPISITSGFSISEALAINTGTLSNGIHKLHVRVKDLDDTWSLYREYNFLVHNFSPQSSAPIDMVEYFFDSDPGIGNGNSISISPNSFNVNESIVIPSSGLSVGTHYLYMRARDTNGNWGLYEALEFEIGTLSVNENSYLVINIYPIPAKEFIDIKTPNQTISNIKLHNAEGKQIVNLSNISSFNTYRMDLTNCNEGIYVIQVETDKGIQYKKIIIR